MVYEIPKSKASIAQNRFEFQFPGDERTFSVPLLQYVKPALALQFRPGADEAELARQLFAEYLPDSLDRFEDGEQLAAFLNAWQEASGVGLGESSDSPN